MGNLAKNYLVCCLLTHTPALLKLPGMLPNTLLSTQKKNIVQEMPFTPTKIDLKKKKILLPNFSSQLDLLIYLHMLTIIFFFRAKILISALLGWVHKMHSN